MFNRTIAAIGMGGLLFLCSSEPVSSDPGFNRGDPGPSDALTTDEHRARFFETHAGANISERADRVRRVYGRAFSNGATALQSAETFRLEHAGMFGVEPDELVLTAPVAGGNAVQPVMYQPDTDTYKFTNHVYQQQHDSVPVFRAWLKLLVRNESGFPLVLASADLRDLGDFHVDAGPVGLPGGAASTDAAVARAALISFDEGDPEVVSARRVIWAGIDDATAPPRLADEVAVRIGSDVWLVLTDARTGGVLYEERLIYDVDITGTITGRATEGIGADICEDEVAVPLPYISVGTMTSLAYTDVNGDYVVTNGGSNPVQVTTTVDGLWFTVFNFAGATDSESSTVTPPGPGDFEYNSANTSEQVRAQVNGYLYPNLIRDYVLAFNPAYPTLNNGGFDVWVNRTDGFCPGNAWYDSSGGGSINFCQSGSGYPNTAWTSVIYHEYGHHLVQAAGSGQSQYGEGMGDVMSVLLLDDPNLGWGFFGTCTSPLRNADNNCQYDPFSCTTNCGSSSHDCGRLLSGCVWSTRNELFTSEPSNYRSIISDLAINAMLVHNGSSITPDITIDYLTLDDDDSDIGNGTPHYAEINVGFSAHNMPAPELALLSFQFPNGLPDLVDPAGGTIIDVVVSGSSATPNPGTGSVFVDVGSGFIETAMNQTSDNVYEAVIPTSDCGATVQYYFRAETTGGSSQASPGSAPADSYSAISAEAVNAIFADDFQANQGWGVQSNGQFFTGTWQRGTPSGSGGSRGDPPTDADGSGQCYVTDNGFDVDVDDGNTILTSPVMDATGGEMFISYWRWFSNTQGSSPFQDIFVVEVSQDGGSNWVNLETVGPTGSEVDGGWFLKTFAVSDFVTPTDQFRIRFTASDTDPQSVVEAGVDGVELIEVVCDAGVLGDVNGDGVVDVLDFFQVIAAWGPCPGPCPPSCAEDLDGNCVVDVIDFFAVIAAWTE